MAGTTGKAEDMKETFMNGYIVGSFVTIAIVVITVVVMKWAHR